jgi:hypothetical protein
MHEVEEECLRVEAGKMICGVVGLQALVLPLGVLDLGQPLSAPS